MSDHDTHEQQQARARLERAAAEIDDITLARLRAVRRRALATKKESHQPLRALWWVPLSAAAIVAVSAITFLWPTPETSVISTATSEDADFVLTKDNPDLVNNDLDFYDWLGDEGDAG